MMNFIVRYLFEHGSRIKLKTPEMLKPVYGVLDSSGDCYGRWFHFLYVEDEEHDFHAVKKLMEENKVWVEYSDRPVDEKKEKGEMLHRGKPDYVAINKDGFLLIEINKNNLYLVKELKQRLKVMYEKYLLNDANRELAAKILDTKERELRISEGICLSLMKNLQRKSVGII